MSIIYFVAITAAILLTFVSSASAGRYHHYVRPGNHTHPAVNRSVYLPDMRKTNGRTEMDLCMEGGVRVNGTLFNATLVRGKFPSETKTRGKRSTNIATFWADKDGGGGSFTADTDQLWYNNLASTGWANTISSFTILDLNYIVCLYTGEDESGTVWCFRSPIQIYDLSNYGLNDAINSIELAYEGTPESAVILFEDSNYEGKSVYLPAASGGTEYPQIDNTEQIAGWGGNIGNDKLSSLILLDWTAVYIYQNTNYGGGVMDYGYSSNSYDYVAQVSHNDWASSLIAYTDA